MDKDAEEVYNSIGSGRNTTINRLAEIVLKLTNKNLQPVHDRPRPGDPRHTLADVTKARGFGCEAKWVLEDGIKRIIPFYANR